MEKVKYLLFCTSVVLLTGCRSGNHAEKKQCSGLFPCGLVDTMTD